jgi:hypothetical protein
MEKGELEWPTGNSQRSRSLVFCGKLRLERRYLSFAAGTASAMLPITAGKLNILGIC